MSEFAGIGKVIKRDPQAHERDPRGLVETWSNGLTKRELFAAMAMQGFIANSALSSMGSSLWQAGASVAAADALILELEKGTT